MRKSPGTPLIYDRQSGFGPSIQERASPKQCRIQAILHYLVLQQEIISWGTCLKTPVRSAF